MATPREVRPLYGPEFQRRFDIFAEKAKISNVPRALIRAYRNIRADVVSGDEITPSQHQIIAQRLLGTPFSSPAQAEYGLKYGLTVAAFKTEDFVMTSTAPCHTTYSEKLEAHHAFLDRMAQHHGCSRDEVAEKISQSKITSDGYDFYQEELRQAAFLLEEVKPLESEARGDSEFNLRMLWGVELRLISPYNSPHTRSIRSAMGDPKRLRRQLREEDLHDVREQVEAYFADSRNQARILILGE